MKNAYKTVLKVLGQEWAHEGETLEEALNFGLEWQVIKGKGTITITKGDKTHTHLFNAPKIRRIVSNDISRAQWAKMLELFLN